MPQLAGGPVAELWHAGERVEGGSEGGIRWAADGHVLFGAVELPGGDAAELEAATSFAYRELLAGCVRLGYPHLLRTWNVVPHINRVDGELERYRLFCRGRAEAFEASLDGTDRFELHLQPIMDISDGRITSAEVLLRLREEDELVPPSRFVYIAERVGLMPLVDAWVVEHSVEMLARLRDRLANDPATELRVAAEEQAKITELRLTRM